MITRRELLVVTGAASLVGSVRYLQEGSHAFVDGLLSAEELSVSKKILEDLKPQVLQLDLVREWRDDLHARIARGAELVVATRWDKALLLRELAREARFVAKQDRIAPSLFLTTLRSRG